MKKPMRNVSDDYLWDQTGEPDPEIQELEQLLGTLRCQPRPLEIPAALQLSRPRFVLRDFKPRLAIAAAIALVVLGAGLWLGLARRERRDTPELVKTAAKPSASDDSRQAAVIVPEDVSHENPNAGNEVLKEPVSVLVERVNRTRRNRPNPTTVAANANRQREIELKTPELAGNELKEAQAGKAHLMLALRVASAKLNLAIKKAQGSTSGNLIHNQHKVG